ncbi:hypothetical protein [Arthrobacter sp. B10-11]|uniref:hypothetical protein n=1 Tax=Arthrobacter sp. B10-11 TaxID=3081160 RepID=UPI002952E45B|nr:hypothetical protein [Arthrobacter sp. B10-11]MDV8148428.1 hypothetical protein [Arthrobacter sp. B10-11]
MAQTMDADQKQQLADWNKRCGKLWLKYFAMVLPPLVLLLFPFIQVLYYFLDVTRPLISRELAYGQPAYHDYQAAKDQPLIILAIFLVLIAAVFYLSNRWYKKAIRVLGPPPVGNTSRWNRLVLGKSQDI